MINKAKLSERDICTKFITPALQRAGWDIQTQLLEEFPFTSGRVSVQGRTVERGERRRADYILFYQPNLPLALIEAKDNRHAVGAGMPQALGYAETLDIPFVYSSNGDAFLEHDRSGHSTPVERELALDAFPSPAQLWARYCAWKDLGQPAQQIVTQDYYTDASGRTPRYYQRVAINRVVEAIARGQQRILLVMATGTGKTYTAFQIIWRLWKSQTRRRILFLTDRNILADQTRTNDFKPFGSAMTKIQHRQVDKSYEIYLALYQAVSGSDDPQNIYRQFSRGFFDLIVVDECHRGSAAEDSAWREILEYFAPATQIGLTATPKETRAVSNSDYFGEPVYTYSLRQGIEDGFLAPYTVVRFDLDADLQGWQPQPGQRDKHGRVIPERVYNQEDFDQELVLEPRTELVARKVTEFLRATDRMAKTIVFCENIDHAERMRRALVNANADLAAQNRRYVVRITGDSEEGKAELDHFIDPESSYPVIVTTSKLLSTGVDAQTCRVIVLDQHIESMAEFKQIIGRGTRINEDYGKLFFTILDFKQATALFADPQFDGDPVQVYTPAADASPVPPDLADPAALQVAGVEFPSAGRAERRVTYVVNDVAVAVVNERVEYYSASGELISATLQDYTRGLIRRLYATLEDFVAAWDQAEPKAALLRDLERQGLLFAALAERGGDALDPFDLLGMIGFDQPPQTRRERAERARQETWLAGFGGTARAVLEALLDTYADQGLEPIESPDVLRIPPFSRLGSPVELIRSFGGKPAYLQALRDMKARLYPSA